MGKDISLKSKDGFEFGAYVAEPQGKPRGAIVVIQEIFGVNHHIRSVTDRYAQLGYLAIAPALFDRGEKNFQSGYDGAAMDKARGMTQKISLDDRLADTQAAIDYAKSAGKVAVLGYCMGGSIAFLSATRLSGVSAGVGYYGGQIAQFASEKPKAPIMLHFGEKDQSIPLTDVDKIKAAHPEAPIFVYMGAGHGFHCDERGSFNAEAAQVAACRSQEFLAKHIG
ncbi:MAG TPA: dienelactone hydrolase family protein [Stellaceae bacterium]|jgi:carboxymethylenebutenolidase|nr:dienelactone hydrolase family protein [Stellaceae bacterium]